MDPSSSTPSGLAGSFGYQKRLLERTASTRGSASLSRTNTIKSNGLNIAPTISYTRAHRVGNSLDAVRGKWEERAKAAEALDSPTTSRSASPTRDDIHRLAASGETSAPAKTPTYLKRQTMPAPIIASPLSPNSTGISVADSNSGRIHLPVSFSLGLTTPVEKAYTAIEASSRFTPSPPSRYRRSNTIDSSIPQDSTGSSTGSNPSSPWTPSFPGPSSPRKPISTYGSSSTPTEPSPSPTRPTARIRPQSLYGASRPVLTPFTSAEPERPSFITPRVANERPDSPSSRISADFQSSAPLKASSIRHDSNSSRILSDQPPVTSSPSVMSPAPYRSSYMAKKYGDTLTAGRRLGRHLPRIASGDGEEHKEEEHVEEQKQTRPSIVSTLPSRRTEPPPELKAKSHGTILHQNIREPSRPSPSSPTSRSLREARIAKLNQAPSPVTSSDPSDIVAGVPGRIPLTRSRTARLPPSPLPSAKLAGRNVNSRIWADKERHLLQAHEYLCHVGEAQQWIEGCLDEELGFGIVEMEEGLQNGVVLARLARVFQGEVVVKRIYEAPKLDFRHSDNINIFFNFVRDAGLPECFIFELTDLYNRKNIPKVIYCIHALSHLLARRGLAQRIGNLLGRLEFSDDQLQKTQKGLKEAGVPMPNFGNVGRELAKEINEEPEPEEIEIETDEERRDRLLMECEDSIIALQSVTRGFLVRKAHTTAKVRINLVERHVPGVQAQCRGVLLRRRMDALRRKQNNLVPWAIGLQAASRGNMARQLWLANLRRIHSIAPRIIGVQAQIRGLIVRRRFHRLKTALRKCQPAIVKLQAVLRGRLVRNRRRAAISVFQHPSIQRPVVSFQSLARGALKRRQVAKHISSVYSREITFVALQAHCRGVLTRRRMRSQLARLEDISQTIVRIQAAARTYLARKRLLRLIRALRKATPMLIGLQARARASLARQEHKNMAKALSRVQVIKSVNTFQARARAALARNRHREQARQLEFVEPDVVGIQACCRGVLARWEYYSWRNHLHRHYPVATILQAMLRGALVRRTFRTKLQYYHDNLQKVVKIQSLFRGKETREQYRQLTMGTNVSADTIKNFVHLLDDSEGDFQEEIKVERLRKLVVEGIRENQALESEVSDLDVKISLIVQNTKTFEELIKSRRRYKTDNSHSLSLLAAHGDPFAGPSTLDHAAKRKRELYQQLFYLLQTKGEYLSRLFVQLSLDSGQSHEKNKRLTERVVLTLFGYGQAKREDYLLLKLFQHAIHEEIAAATSIEDIIRSHPMFTNVAVQYIRPRQLVYVREAFQTIIRAVLQEENLSLEVDPTVIHRMRIDFEELQTGVPSNEPKEVRFREALEVPQTRVQYIHHLQTLQAWTEAFVTAILGSTRKMPYSMRYLARETLLSLQEKFPDAPLESYAACIAKLVYYRYINPAIVTPETFDIVSSTVDIKARKNLAQISRVLTQITSGGEFGDDNPSFLPINEFVNKSIVEMTNWMLEVANVQDAEAQLQAHEFLDATLQPKPIFITPNEIYGMHSLLSQYLPSLAPANNDSLRVILNELNGVPHFGSDELKDARDTPITLDLTNRFAEVKDPLADEKALWVQAKRGVLAILRVQPAKNLWDSLTAQVIDEHEILWQEVLENEDEQQRHMSRRMPSSTGADSAYRLEDIRSLSFKEVKLHTIHFLVELEKKDKVTRADGFQEILNAIAGDVRSKHRKRIQRQQEIESMKNALKLLAERKKQFEEKLESYNSYIETSIASMQKKGKKGFVLPFTKQYFHDRDLKRSGRVPQYGSYINSAKDLYEKRILLSIDQYSPRQFDKMNFTISSNTPGVFTVLLESTTSGITTRVASEDVKMEDLLQAKFEDRASLSLFKNTVKMNLELFIAHINKKFYV